MKKILHMYQQTAERFSGENTKSFRNDSSRTSQSSVTGIKSMMNEGLSKLNENLKNISLGNIEGIWNRNDIDFVVDWQVPDSV